MTLTHTHSRPTTQIPVSWREVAAASLTLLALAPILGFLV